MKNLVFYERATDTVGPLLFIALFLTFRGQGFETFVPVVACIVFSVIQPFVRFFLFDRVRGPLVRSGQARVLLTASGVLYLALALLICKVVTS